MEIVFLLFIALLLTVFWASQLLDLMRQRDDAFPGKWDKVLWVVVVLAVPLIGAVLYSMRIPRPLTQSPKSLEREWERIQERRNQGGGGATS